MNATHNYNSEDISQQVQGIHDKEEDIMGRINTRINNELNVQWNADANTYIWGLFYQIIVQNGVIWTFITSILALGIMKLILGR